MKHTKLTITAIAAAAIGFATTAWAGSPVYGYGDTRAAAVADANRNAEIESNSRFGRRDCYTAVKPQNCKKDSGGWVCTASVANHQGSCGS